MNYNRYPLPNTRHEGEQRADYSDDTLSGPDQLTAPNTVAEGFGGSIPPHEQARIHHLNKNEKGPGLSTRVVLGLAATATTIAAVGGVWAAILVGKSKNEAPEPSDRPSTSAPAVPGETVSPAEGLTVNTFPFESEGKTYNGVAELEQGYGIRVDDYPTAEEVAPRLLEVVNASINYGTANPAEDERWKDYIAADQQTVGSQAIVKDFANPAFESIIFTDSDEPGAGISSWKQHLRDLHDHNLALDYQARQEGGSFHGKYSLEPDGINVAAYTDTMASMTLRATYTTNNEVRPVLLHFGITKVGEHWKIFSASEETIE